jgi:hypothetical protein
MLASSKEKSTKYRLLHLNPLNMTGSSSILDTTTSDRVNKHWRLWSHSYRLIASWKSTEKPREHLKLRDHFDVATLPSPWTFPFELSPNVILSYSSTSLSSEVNVRGLPVICWVQPLSTTQWFPLSCSSPTCKMGSSLNFRHPNLYGGYNFLNQRLCYPNWSTFVWWT